MAEITREYGNTPIIQISLEPDFIKRYHLETLLSKSSFYDTFLLSKNQTDRFNYIFLFPPNKVNHSEIYLKGFLELYNSLIERYKLAGHADRLLFLSNVYTKINLEKQKEIAEQNVLRQKGKLLIDFISVPIKPYTIDNIREALGIDELDDFDVEDLLEVYVSIVCKTPKDTFKFNGKIDLSKIPYDKQRELIRRIQIDQNISIEIENGNNLIVSKHIKPKFGYLKFGKTKNFGIKVDWQNQQILKLVVESLFEEQKMAKTDLYYALREFDFFLPGDYSKIRHTVNSYKRQSHHTYNLQFFHTALIDYFKHEKILQGYPSIVENNRRNDFIYEYLILFSFFKKTTPVEKIGLQLKDFEDKRKKKKGFAAKAFSDRFKNLDRKNNLEYNLLRSMP